MKKWICMLLVLSLITTMVMTASAAEVEVTEDDISVSVEKKEQDHDLQLKESSSYAIDGADRVTIDGNTYVVETGTVTLYLDLDPSLGFICLTQDLMASVENYFMLSDDPEGLMNALIDENIHFLLLSGYSFMEVDILTIDSDEFAEQIGTLSQQSDLMKEAYAAMFGPANGFNDYELKEIGINTWIALTPDLYVTIVDGNYIVVETYTEDGSAMTEDDVLDLDELLASLTIAVG